VTGVDSMMADGSFRLHSHDTDYAVVGGAIAYNLQLNPNDFFSQLEVYAPRRNAGSFTHPEEAFNRRYIQHAGVFAIQQDFDSKYVLVPLRFAREILEDDASLSSLELRLAGQADPDAVKSALQQQLGAAYNIQTRFEQHDLLYRIMKSEK